SCGCHGASPCDPPVRIGGRPVFAGLAGSHSSTAGVQSLAGDWPRPFLAGETFMTPNPFIRGYRDLYQVRTLLICPEGGAPLWRPLHASQARLSDVQVVRSPCLFNEEFAVVGEGHVVADELLAQCQSEGLALSVVYSLEARDFDGSPGHVGDTYTREAARERVRRLGFETGF